MDKTHRYSRTDPGGAKRHDARDAKPIFIQRPEDAGDSVEKKRPAPPKKGAATLPQYVAGKPTGSAADVRARGRWKDGRWTLELSRKLDTGHADDTKLELGKSYRIAIASFDNTGEMDRASRVIVLKLGE